MKILVTGGAGFIGSEVVRQLVRETEHSVVLLDSLTYAADVGAVEEVAGDARHAFEKVDIRDAPEVARVFATHQPDAVLHLAAESHVDRSIDAPAVFIETNVNGTFTMLQEALRHWRALGEAARARFRFVHVSTDEVFGSLGPTGAFHEDTPYRPSSPYSASKAAADHLARAWHHTFDLPVLVTNCSNNYGPRQFPEKLIPLVILKALDGKPIPVYGKGDNVRDWLFVSDHARALRIVLERGRVGESYNLGGASERTNLQVVEMLCRLVDELVPSLAHRPCSKLVTFVPDRPGHDLRYAMDTSKVERELDWRPSETLESGLRKTVAWYVANRAWCERARASYAGQRLGVSSPTARQP